MENKYYTPTIEEFRVGFEYEQVSINPQEDITVSDEIKYEQCTFPDPFVGYNLNRLVLNMCRVKYLDKKDIEGCNWIFEKEYPYGLKFYLNNPELKRVLFYKVETNSLTIDNDESYEDNTQYFQGTIKNKSELITLLKQLNIK